MPTATKAPHLDKEALLRQSTRIDRRIVEAHEQLEKKLLKLGVEIKPSRYSLEHPLGTHKARAHNVNR